MYFLFNKVGDFGCSNDDPAKSQAIWMCGGGATSLLKCQEIFKNLKLFSTWSKYVAMQSEARQHVYSTLKVAKSCDLTWPLDAASRRMGDSAATFCNFVGDGEGSCAWSLFPVLFQMNIWISTYLFFSLQTSGLIACMCDFLKLSRCHG